MLDAGASSAALATSVGSTANSKGIETDAEAGRTEVADDVLEAEGLATADPLPRKSLSVHVTSLSPGNLSIGLPSAPVCSSSDAGRAG